MHAFFFLQLDITGISNNRLWMERGIAPTRPYVTAGYWGFWLCDRGRHEHYIITPEYIIHYSHQQHRKKIQNTFEMILGRLHARVYDVNALSSMGMVHDKDGGQMQHCTSYCIFVSTAIFTCSKQIRLACKCPHISLIALFYGRVEIT